MDDIITQYMEEDKDKDEESRGVTGSLIPISSNRALQALCDLCQYEEEHIDGDLKLLHLLRLHERELRRRIQLSKQQCTIDSFFYS